MLGLDWLVRPELVLYSIAFLVTVLVVQWDATTWRSRVRLLAATVALPLAYQLFRMGFYGEVLANTAIAKEGTRLRWQRGWRYFLDFVEPYWFFVPFAVLLVGGYAPLSVELRRSRDRRSTWVIGAFVVASLVNAGYVVGVGGDYEHARLLLPSVFALWAPVAMIPVTRRYLAALALTPWAIAAAFVLRPPPHHVGQGFLVPTAGKVTSNDFGWGKNSPNLRTLSTPGLHLLTGLVGISRLNLPLLANIRQPAGVSIAIGVSSYASGNNLYVFDVLGLADPLTARLKTPLYTGLLPYPGHEKELLPPWAAARLFAAGVQVAPSQLYRPRVALIASTTGSEFQDEVRWARAAIQCPAIRRLDRDTTATMSVSRFFGNVLDSFANTRLRISPDPETAYHQLCRNATVEVPGSCAPRRSPRATTANATFAPTAHIVTIPTSSTRTVSMTTPRVVAVAGFV